MIWKKWKTFFSMLEKKWRRGMIRETRCKSFLEVFWKEILASENFNKLEESRVELGDKRNQVHQFSKNVLERTFLLWYRGYNDELESLKDKIFFSFVQLNGKTTSSTLSRRQNKLSMVQLNRKSSLIHFINPLRWLRLNQCERLPNSRDKCSE